MVVRGSASWPLDASGNWYLLDNGAWIATFLVEGAPTDLPASYGCIDCIFARPNDAYKHDHDYGYDSDYEYSDANRNNGYHANAHDNASGRRT